MRVDRNWGIALLIVTAIVVAASFAGLTAPSDSEITPNDQFFKVSLGAPPVIDANTWRLQMDGLVERPQNFTYSDIVSLPNITEAVRLTCVVGLTDRAYWTGVRVTDLMQVVGVDPSAKEMVLVCADGYSTSLTIEEASASGVILAWGMNNVTLPVDQGFPLRLVAPDQFGYKWAKWITQIVFVGYDYKGYWESRGWADDASMKPASNWRVHAALLSVAAVLGGFSALSGMRNSQSARLAKRIPPLFAKKYHRYVSAGFYLILYVTFIYWALQTYDLRGAVFYTFHGRMALLTIAISIVGVVSGIPLLSGSGKLRLVHWVANMTAYLLLLITIAFGIAIIV